MNKRKNIRLPEYNYAQNGGYFVTMCVKDMKCILGKIKPVGAINNGQEKCISPKIVGAGFHPRPQIELSHIGKIVDKTIKYINENYTNVQIDKYVIMPNHIHMIIILGGPGGHGNPPLPSIIGQLKSYVTKQLGFTI